MSSYHNSQISVSEDGLTAVQTFPGIEGLTGTFLDGDLTEVELVDDEAKPTLADLRKKAKSLGVKADVANHLTEAELVDVIERMTANSD